MVVVRPLPTCVTSSPVTEETTPEEEKKPSPLALQSAPFRHLLATRQKDRSRCPGKEALTGVVFGHQLALCQMSLRESPILPQCPDLSLLLLPGRGWSSPLQAGPESLPRQESWERLCRAHSHKGHSQATESSCQHPNQTGSYQVSTGVPGLGDRGRGTLRKGL